MTTITLPEDFTEIRLLFEQANDGDVIIQLADGRQFILSAIDDLDIEIARSRQNQKLMEFLEKRAKQTKTIPLDEFKRRLDLI
ncbi:MAG: hypothetical protein MUE44_01485 [Oscillatoriaceae cyanobacterium Prado104]|jgi:hypothetical protein|nr:hypothetical protein [Oscillatoriaceae cyanobacterium Prado104]